MKHKKLIHLVEQKKKGKKRNLIQVCKVSHNKTLVTFLDQISRNQNKNSNGDSLDYLKDSNHFIKCVLKFHAAGCAKLESDKFNILLKMMAFSVVIVFICCVVAFFCSSRIK